ncbi:hypothetical protein OHA27_11130 [Streptomyces sp. NBC_01619]|uniref:hypothetical protein n=1 Tax=Streptomyces sp. NBC_01619 TaxID=2975901 RepID=UPI002254633C|nr:hypothetical protein [Streptomyces sp. NBC_01619]MCX4510849.1 hypothetical protein [Streptomyces sp. NBC_01619]
MPDVPVPDHFDRLLARYTAPGAARVRPRLPGPFERVEALRTAPPEPGDPAPLVPAAPPASGPAGEQPRPVREVRTERHTVVRTEGARPGEPGPAPAGLVPSTPLLLPRAAAAPGPREVAAASPPASRGAPSSATAPGTRRQSPGVVARAADPAPASAPLAPARPRGADTAAARGATPSGIGRRAPRPAERVVHVQIGRLEVSAAPPPGASRPARDRPDHTGRRGPALTLDDYLARGETRD